MRLFIAVPVPPLPGIVSWLMGMRARLPRGRWVPGENLHLTLKFLGEMEALAARRVEDVLAGVAREAVPFSLSLKGMGSFPEGRGRWTIYARCGEGEKPLAALAERVAGALEDAGIRREARAFKAHVTLGRGVGERVALEDRAWGEFPVARIALMKSELGPGRAVYTERAAFLLGDAGKTT